MSGRTLRTRRAADWSSQIAVRAPSFQSSKVPSSASLELLLRLAQCVDFVCPSILVCNIARLAALDALKRALPRHFGSCPALFSLPEPAVKFCHARGRITLTQRATRSKHPLSFPAALRSQHPAAHRHAGPAERLKRRDDLLVRELTIHARTLLPRGTCSRYLDFGASSAPNVPRVPWLLPA